MIVRHRVGVDDTLEPFDSWAVVEQMGHRRLAGRVSEVQLAGGGYLRLDVPATPGGQASTHYLSHASIYGIHVVSEALARRVAEQYRPEPVQRWELPAAPPPSPSQLERDLEQFAAAVENVTCDHGTLTVPEPGCAGCIARAVRIFAERHAIGDDDGALEDAAALDEPDLDGPAPF